MSAPMTATSSTAAPASGRPARRPSAGRSVPTVAGRRAGDDGRPGFDDVPAGPADRAARRGIGHRGARHGSGRARHPPADRRGGGGRTRRTDRCRPRWSPPIVARCTWRCSVSPPVCTAARVPARRWAVASRWAPACSAAWSTRSAARSTASAPSTGARDVDGPRRAARAAAPAHHRADAGGRAGDRRVHHARPRPARRPVRRLRRRQVDAARA